MILISGVMDTSGNSEIMNMIGFRAFPQWIWKWTIISPKLSRIILRSFLFYFPYIYHKNGLQMTISFLIGFLIISYACPPGLRSYVQKLSWYLWKFEKPLVRKIEINTSSGWGKICFLAYIWIAYGKWMHLLDGSHFSFGSHSGVFERGHK